MKNAIWISYDLGVRGDYEGMYSWLDNHDAKECGDSLAFMNYECISDLLNELKSSLGESISLTKKTRIYIIHLNPTTRKMKGTWLFGTRKAPPWSGYAGGVHQEDEGEG